MLTGLPGMPDMAPGFASCDASTEDAMSVDLSLAHFIKSKGFKISGILNQSRMRRYSRRRRDVRSSEGKDGQGNKLQPLSSASFMEVPGGHSRQRPPLGRRPKIPERSGSKSSTLNIPELTSMLMLGRWHMPSGKRSVGLQGFGNNFAIASQLYQLSDQPANKALILSRMLDSCGRKVKSDRHNGAM